MTLHFHLCVTNKSYAIKQPYVYASSVFLLTGICLNVIKVTCGFQRNFYNDITGFVSFFWVKIISV